MLSKKMESALNAQINAEFWSAYLYLSMSAHFAGNGLSGFAHWFKHQFKEEQEHATKFMDYVISRGGTVALTPIEKVTQSWASPLAAFEDTLAHEKTVTSLIHNLVTLANEEKDYATASLLKWYVDEQVEEEGTAQGYVDALKFIGNDKVGLYMLNTELGKR
ncbi:MAG: ferritin [Prevotella sp.]|jgi:ferritin|nr:ferritin [Prevotella sp.]